MEAGEGIYDEVLAGSYLISMDTIITKLSPHGTRHRVWLEDSFGRLSRNGFSAGDGVDVSHRAGSGLLVKKGDAFSKNSISARRNTPLFALDGAWVLRRFEHADFLRVRLSYNAISIVPRVITASITRAGVRAAISGNVLVVDHVGYQINTPKPTLLPFRIKALHASVDAANILYSMEVIINNRPESVTLDGVERSVASAYLVDAGYSLGEDGVFSL